MAITSVIAPTNTIELIGVLNRGCRRENHEGNKWSQPATIGNRELPVTWTLVEEIVRLAINKMPKEATAPAIGKARSTSRRDCGTGPMRSIGLFPMNTSTELVP